MCTRRFFCLYRYSKRRHQQWIQCIQWNARISLPLKMLRKQFVFILVYVSISYLFFPSSFRLIKISGKRKHSLHTYVRLFIYPFSKIHWLYEKSWFVFILCTLLCCRTVLFGHGSFGLLCCCTHRLSHSHSLVAFFFLCEHFGCLHISIIEYAQNIHTDSKFHSRQSVTGR